MQQQDRKWGAPPPFPSNCRPSNLEYNLKASPFTIWCRRRHLSKEKEKEFSSWVWWFVFGCSISATSNDTSLIPLLLKMDCRVSVCWNVGKSDKIRLLRCSNVCKRVVFFVIAGSTSAASLQNPSMLNEEGKPSLPPEKSSTKFFYRPLWKSSLWKYFLERFHYIHFVWKFKCVFSPHYSPLISNICSKLWWPYYFFSPYFLATSLLIVSKKISNFGSESQKISTKVK